MNYKKMNKAQLIEHIKGLEIDVEYYKENTYTDDQMSESYDRGFDFGYKKWMEAAEFSNGCLSEEDLKYYGNNILRFG